MIPVCKTPNCILLRLLSPNYIIPKPFSLLLIPVIERTKLIGLVFDLHITFGQSLTMSARFMHLPENGISRCLIFCILKYLISVLEYFEVLQGIISVWRQMNLPLHYWNLPFE